MNGVIILGSARSNGNTAFLVKELANELKYDIVDLDKYTISGYDYNNENKEDDFIPLIEKIMSTYEVIIFATPVYWYAMSAIMKLFFDRLTDVITIKKGIGRLFSSKKVLVVTTSSSDHLGDVFWIPFEKTCEYFSMNFLGGYHSIDKKEIMKDVQKIKELLQ